MSSASKKPSSARRNVLLSLGAAAAIVCGIFLLLRLFPFTKTGKEPGERGPVAGRAELPSQEGAVPGVPIAKGRASETAAPGPEAEAAEETEPPLLRGRVTGEGSGIAGASVLLFSVREVERALLRLEDLLPQGELPDIPSLIQAIRGELDRFRRSANVTKTSEDGTYEFYRIEPTSYIVLATAEDWLFRYGDVVNLTAGQTEELDIELDRGGSISGRVLATEGGGLEGVSVLAEFRPPGIPSLGRIVRRLLSYLNGEFLKGPFECRSGPDGSFHLAGLPPGTYDLHASAPDRPETTVPGIPTGSSDVAIYIGPSAQVRGHLVDLEGLPVAGVAVFLEEVEDRSQLPLVAAPFSKLLDTLSRLFGEEPKIAVSEEDGAFLFDALAPGRYQLRVEQPGLLPFEKSVEVTWGQVLELGFVRVDRGEAITGWVFSEGGAPIEGARVVVAPARPNFLNMGPALSDFLSGRLVATSGPTGLFRIGGLLPAEYQVVVTARAHAPGSVRGVRPGGEPLRIHLQRGARLQGRVKALATGAPIPGARVRVEESRTTTDAEGRFELDGVSPRDRWRDIFSFPGMNRPGEPANSVTVEVAAPGYLDARERYDLSLGKELEILLAPAPEIRGVVVNAEGKPLPGALVRLAPWIPQEIPPFLDFIGDGTIFLAVGTTDLEGRFRLAGFRGGRPEMLYRVAADHILYARGFSEPFKLEGKTGDQGGSLGVQMVEEPEGPEGSKARPAGAPGAEVVVRLERAARIFGIVTDSKNPVSSAAIRLSRQPAASNPEAERFMQLLGSVMALPKAGKVAYTNRDGRFSYEGVRAGTYSISCEIPGYVAPPAQTVEISAGEEREVNFVVDPGGEIRGVVADPAGSPLPGATIRCFREPEPGDSEGARLLEAQKLLGGAFRAARSGAEGEFTIAGLPPGRYTLAAEKPRYSRRELNGISPGDPEVRIVLIPAGSIAGTVFDVATGAPIQRFAVAVRKKGEGPPAGRFAGFPTEASDSSGRFVREDLEPGLYEVEVSSPGYSRARADSEVSPGAVTELRFPLARSGVLSGLVFDADTRAGIANVRLTLVEEAAEPGEASEQKEVRERPSERRRERVARVERGREERREGTTSSELTEDDSRAIQETFSQMYAGRGASTREDGGFTFEDLPLAPFGVTISHPEYIPEVRRGLTLGPGQELRLEIPLRRGLVLSGVVREDTGLAAGGRWIFLRGAGEENSRIRKSALVAEDGSFRFGGLEPGTYRLIVPPRGGGLPGSFVMEIELRDHRTGLEVTVPAR